MVLVYSCLFGDTSKPFPAKFQRARHVHPARRATADDLYVLVMCHDYLGDPIRANDCYTRAVRRHEANPQHMILIHAESLNALRAEADSFCQNSFSKSEAQVR
jgi:hypothetical protein